MRQFAADFNCFSILSFTLLTYKYKVVRQHMGLRTSCPSAYFSSLISIIALRKLLSYSCIHHTLQITGVHSQLTFLCQEASLIKLVFGNVCVASWSTGERKTQSPVEVIYYKNIEYIYKIKSLTISITNGVWALSEEQSAQS